MPDGDQTSFVDVKGGHEEIEAFGIIAPVSLSLSGLIEELFEEENKNLFPRVNILFNVEEVRYSGSS